MYCLQIFLASSIIMIKQLLVGKTLLEFLNPNFNLNLGQHASVFSSEGTQLRKTSLFKVFYPLQFGFTEAEKVTLCRLICSASFHCSSQIQLGSQQCIQYSKDWKGRQCYIVNFQAIKFSSESGYWNCYPKYLKMQGPCMLKFLMPH